MVSAIKHFNSIISRGSSYNRLSNITRAWLDELDDNNEEIPINKMWRLQKEARRMEKEDIDALKNVNDWLDSMRKKTNPDDLNAVAYLSNNLNKLLLV
jgi:hypothetical protein